MLRTINKTSCLPTASIPKRRGNKTTVALAIYGGMWELILEWESYGNIHEDADSGHYFFFTQLINHVS